MRNRTPRALVNIRTFTIYCNYVLLLRFRRGLPDGVIPDTSDNRTFMTPTHLRTRTFMKRIAESFMKSRRSGPGSKLVLESIFTVLRDVRKFIEFVLCDSESPVVRLVADGDINALFQDVTHTVKALYDIEVSNKQLAVAERAARGRLVDILTPDELRGIKLMLRSGFKHLKFMNLSQIQNWETCRLI